MRCSQSAAVVSSFPLSAVPLPAACALAPQVECSARALTARHARAARQLALEPAEPSAKPRAAIAQLDGLALEADLAQRARARSSLNSPM